MEDKYYSDWDALAKAAEKKTKEILLNDVAPVAEEIFKKRIQSDIYDAYTPKPNGWVSIGADGVRHRTTYQRRYSLGDAVTSRLQSEDTLLVTSTAKASPAVVKGWSFRDRYAGVFLKLLESGNMGIWRGGFARPAVTNTEREFLFGKDIPNAIKKGITKRIGQFEDN